MKQYTIGMFKRRSDAEAAVSAVHQKLGVDKDEISYVYRSSDGTMMEMDAEEISGKTAGERAVQGATIGGGVGALAGVAAAAGIIPVVGPIVAAGSLGTALGVGTSALGTTVAGAATGAAAGGIIGALSTMGVSEPSTKRYEDMVAEGNIMVGVHADSSTHVAATLEDAGAVEVSSFRP